MNVPTLLEALWRRDDIRAGDTVFLGPETFCDLDKEALGVRGSGQVQKTSFGKGLVFRKEAGDVRIEPHPAVDEREMLVGRRTPRPKYAVVK